MFPFHTWLPDAHTEAPTAGSVILAGVLLKMGTYGFIRFSLPLLPQDPAARHKIVTIMLVVSIIGIHLRRAGLHDAEGHEEADRLQLGQPPGLLHAGHFRADAARAFRQRDPADQPRNFHRRVVLDRRRAVRAAAHALDFGIRRALDAHAEFRGDLHDRHAQLAGLAAAQRIHRRVHHPARHVRSEHQVRGVGRDRHRSGRGVLAVALPARDVRAGHESRERASAGPECARICDAGSAGDSVRSGSAFIRSRCSACSSGPCSRSSSR